MGVQLLKGIDEVVARPEVHVLENSSHWLQQDKCAPCLAPACIRLGSCNENDV